MIGFIDINSTTCDLDPLKIRMGSMFPCLVFAISDRTIDVFLEKYVD